MPAFGGAATEARGGGGACCWMSSAVVFGWPLPPAHCRALRPFTSSRWVLALASSRTCIHPSILAAQLLGSTNRTGLQRYRCSLQQGVFLSVSPLNPSLPRKLCKSERSGSPLRCCAKWGDIEEPNTSITNNNTCYTIVRHLRKCGSSQGVVAEGAEGAAVSWLELLGETASVRPLRKTCRSARSSR